MTIRYAKSVTPRHLRRAEKAGLDTSTVHGSAPDGAITGPDLDTAVRQLEAAAMTAPPTPAPQASDADTWVQLYADSHGLDLAGVTGTGPSGAVTLSDVSQAVFGDLTADLDKAGLISTAAPTARVQAAPVGPRPRTTASAFEHRSTWSEASVTVDAFSLNPLVDDAKQAVPAVYRAATGEGPAPTLFASGDLPLFVVSGADPKLLARLPWVARHAAARATAAELQAMLERYAGDGWTEAEMRFGTDPGNADYRARVSSWLKGPPVDRYSERSPARQAAAEETYDSVYGAQNAYQAQQAAQKKAEREERERAQAESLRLRRARHGR